MQCVRMCVFHIDGKEVWPVKKMELFEMMLVLR